MIDVTFEYYSEEYFGDVLDTTNFPKFRKRAWNEVNHYTQGRAGAVEESTADATVVTQIKDCVCAVADAVVGFEETSGKVVSSESIGSYSVSYSSKSSDMSSNKVIKGIVNKYLGRCGLTVYQIY